MDRRIIGVETEFGIHYSHPGTKPLTPEEVARYLFRPVVEWGRSSNVFILNGSRLYLDVGSHPEYATAECSTLPELIATDKAGELIMNRLVTTAQRQMRDDGFEGTIYLYKNNADSQGNSFGSHENYLLHRSTEFRRLSESLIPFLITRQLMCGSGAVITDASRINPDGHPGVPEQPHFAFSHRADYVQEGISSSTTRSRPIINTRDEPHADASQYRRLHVIVGDSNMSETTQMVRFGSTDLMLRMIEAGIPLKDFQLDHPVQAIRQVSHDLTGTAPLRLRNGRRMSALQLQEHFLDRARSFVDRQGAHHEHVPAVLDLWERALTAVRTQDHSGIDTEIDWAIKHRFYQQYAERNGLGWDAARLAQLDLSYHDIDPERGLFNLLARRGAAARWVTDADVSHAAEHPPASTRASLRGRFIRTARERELEYTVDWTHMKLNDKPICTVMVKDPFALESEQMEHLLECFPSCAAPLE
ncbi:MAG: Pup--protein ligase [Micrococcaceae bacterium]